MKKKNNNELKRLIKLLYQFMSMNRKQQLELITSLEDIYKKRKEEE